MSEIKAVRMPKWGLAMEEGTLVAWHRAPGETVARGDELADIETTKITNILEATEDGVLARLVADEGDELPVGALIAVLTIGEVSEAEIDAFVAANAEPVVVDEEDGADSALVQQAIEVGGRRVNVATAGAGAPIVLLHGWSGDLNNWQFAIEALKKRGRVIALDLPGHGASSKDVGDGSLAAMAAAVDGALDALGVEGAQVIGHSFGAAVAAQLALDHPTRVAALTLVCPAGLPGTTLSDAFLDSLMTAERARDVKAALQLLVADPSAVGRDMVDGMARQLRLDGARDALRILGARMRAGEDFAALRAALDRLPPALVIASKNDGVVGAPDEAALPAGWALAWIEGAGHLPHIEQASAFNELVTQRLAAA